MFLPSESEVTRFCSAICVLLLAGVMPLLGQYEAPSMIFDNPEKNFGKVMQGETVKHVFSFSNEGSGTLEILGVEAACGCQATSLSAKQIEAGMTGQIVVSVDTAGLAGAIDKSVHITTNDPQRPKVVLSIRAVVQPEISLSSPSIFFENVPNGKEVTQEVFITVETDKPIKILSAESSDESVSVKLESVPDGKGKKVKLIATHKGDGKFGYRLESAVVRTSSFLTPELSIYLIIRNFNR